MATDLTAQNDPLGRSASILADAPGALEIGLKRLGMEQDDAQKKAALKQKAAELKQKTAEDRRKAFEWTPKTVFLPHRQAYEKGVADLIMWQAQKEHEYTQGKGYNPLETGNPVNAEYQIRKAALEQDASSYNQLEKFWEAETLEYRRLGADAFEPGAYEQFTASVNDPNAIREKKMPDGIGKWWDYGKYLDGIMKDVPLQAWANTPDIDWETGAIRTKSGADVSDTRILKLVAGAMMHPYAERKAKEMFSHYSDQEAVRAGKEAEIRGWSIEHQVTFDRMKAVTKRDYSVGLTGVWSPGEQNEASNAQHLFEFIKGATSGTLEGEGTGEFTLDGTKYGDVDRREFNTLREWKGKDPIPENSVVLKSLNRATYKVIEKDVDGKPVEVKSNIRGILRNNDNNTFKVFHSEDKDANDPKEWKESEWFPADQFPTEVGIPVAKHNTSYATVKALEKQMRQEGLLKGKETVETGLGPLKTPAKAKTTGAYVPD